MAEARFEAAIFDVDELMIRSERNRSLAFETMIRNRGGMPAPNEYGVVQTIGINVRDNCQRMKLQYSLDGDPDELAAEHESAYTELLATGVKAMPGLYPLVALLGRKGIKLAIASSGSLEHIDMAIHGERGLFPPPLPSPFQAIASGKEVRHGKPAPDIYLLAAQRLGVPIANCVVFEDAPNGIIGADTAGAKTVAVPSEFTQAGDFSKATEEVASLEHITWEFLSGLYLPKTP